jgi:hypothetical protein
MFFFHKLKILIFAKRSDKLHDSIAYIVPWAVEIALNIKVEYIIQLLLLFKIFLYLKLLTFSEKNKSFLCFSAFVSAGFITSTY